MVSVGVMGSRSGLDGDSESVRPFFNSFVRIVVGGLRLP
jgi:hypothetical protein